MVNLLHELHCEVLLSKCDMPADELRNVLPVVSEFLQIFLNKKGQEKGSSLIDRALRLGTQEGTHLSLLFEENQALQDLLRLVDEQFASRDVVSIFHIF